MWEEGTQQMEEGTEAVWCFCEKFFCMVLAVRAVQAVVANQGAVESRKLEM